MDYNISVILADITPEELPSPYCDVARAVNLETALQLAKLYQGTHLYFPKLDEVLRAKRNGQIRKEFNGYNHKELAIKFNVTDRWIRELVEEGKDESQFGIDNYL